ncbi:MAG: hypothetical protein KIT09_33935 [Bryobacteraceae bacterium]|nr:hypothetical protein [Bryobacteraceae bacterium]
MSAADGPPVHHAKGQWGAVLLAGLGVGWITGLSVSPVVATVLSSIIGIVAGGAAGLAALDDKAVPKRVNAWPIAILVLGVSIGSPMGVVARSRDLFGRAAARPPETSAVVVNQELLQKAALGVLYSAQGRDCERLLGSPDASLPSALRTSSLPWAPRVAERFTDVAIMRRVVECLCEK